MTKPIVLIGRFFDGRSSKPYEVLCRVTSHNMALAKASDPSDILAVWPVDEVRDDKAARKMGGAILRRSRDDDAYLELGDDAPSLDHLKAWFPNLLAKSALHTRGAREVLLYIGISISALVALFALLIPYAASRLADNFPDDYAVQIGDSVIERMTTIEGARSNQSGLCRDEASNQIIQSLVDQLAEVMGMSDDQPLRAVIINSPIRNAAALPGGRMLVFGGLIGLAENGDQLAAVIAHELGHVKHRDPLRQTIHAGFNGILIGLLIGDVTGGAVLTVAVENALNSAYSRDAEGRADEAAHDAIAKLGGDPAQLGAILALLTSENGDPPALLQVFSSHPSLKDRLTTQPNPNGDPFRILSRTDFETLKKACGLGPKPSGEKLP